MDREVTLLYGGAVRLEFERERHRYEVVIGNRRSKVPSVTSITGIVDKSRPLVYWAINMTLDSIRSSVQPGVAYTERELEEILNAAKQFPHSVKQEAADIGTAAHSWIEQYFKDPNPGPPMPDDDALHRPCVDACLGWLAAHHVKILHGERAVYSRRHRCSGRLDWIGEVDGAKTILDWKTGAAVYPEAALQTAAYNAFYEEENQDEYIERRAVIRLGKLDGKFHSHIYERFDLKPDFKAFLAALRLSRRIKQIEKADRGRGKDWMEELTQ